MSNKSIDKIATFVAGELRKQTNDFADALEMFDSVETRQLIIRGTLERLILQLAVDSESELGRNELTPIVERTLDILDQEIPGLLSS